MSSSVPAGDWLVELARDAQTDARPELSRYHTDEVADARPSSVLMLVADPAGGGRILLVERSSRLRDHPAEVTFPGGSLMPREHPSQGAVREAVEETGLAADRIEVMVALPPLHLAWSNFLVHPVLARWPGTPPEVVPDGGEVTAARWVALDTLADPSRRFQVRYPTGYVAPAFLVDGMLVWGFTGSLLGWLLRLAGRERPWDRERVDELADALVRFGGGYGR